MPSLVGSEMCIRDSSKSQAIKRSKSKNKGIEAANAMVKMIECLI